MNTFCAVLLTEDLQDGQELDGVRVVNPFRGDAPVAHERAASYARTAARGRSGAGGGPAERRGARGKHR